MIPWPRRRTRGWSVEDGVYARPAPHSATLPAVHPSAPRMIRAWPIILAVWIGAVSLAPVAHAAVSFYVSPTGDDSNPGTEAATFQSIARAQTAVRPLTATMTRDLTVVLRGGLYQLTEARMRPLAFHDGSRLPTAQRFRSPRLRLEGPSRTTLN